MDGDSSSLAAFASVLDTLTPQVYRGSAYRFIGTRFAARPLSGAGSLLHGGRFNPPASFEVLYSALSAETAMAEREGLLLTAPGIRLADRVGTGVLLRIRCQLDAVLDLTDQDIRRALGISEATLLGPWLPWNTKQPPGESVRTTPRAPTQLLGTATRTSRRFEALLAPSAKDPDGRCLAILVDRLRPSSKVEVDDPDGSLRATLGLVPPQATR